MYRTTVNIVHFDLANMWSSWGSSQRKARRSEAVSAQQVQANLSQPSPFHCFHGSNGKKVIFAHHFKLVSALARIYPQNQINPHLSVGFGAS